MCVCVFVLPADAVAHSFFPSHRPPTTQTSKHLYIITEKGGKDLFESFDDQPDGIPEPWALEIITGVVKATLYCHEVGLGHSHTAPTTPPVLVPF